MNQEKKRVIFDTNALISAVIKPDSFPSFVFEYAKTHEHLFYSSATLAELRRVVDLPKFETYRRRFGDNREGFFLGYQEQATEANPAFTVTDCRDKDDNKFLALALSVDAEIIVSGDSDLLVLNPYQNIRILTIRQYAQDRGLAD